MPTELKVRELRETENLDARIGLDHVDIYGDHVAIELDFEDLIELKELLDSVMGSSLYRDWQYRRRDRTA